MTVTISHQGSPSRISLPLQPLARLHCILQWVALALAQAALGVAEAIRLRYSDRHCHSRSYRRTLNDSSGPLTTASPDIKALSTSISNTRTTLVLDSPQTCKNCLQPDSLQVLTLRNRKMGEAANPTIAFVSRIAQKMTPVTAPNTSAMEAHPPLYPLVGRIAACRLITVRDHATTWLARKILQCFDTTSLLWTQASTGCSTVAKLTRISIRACGRPVMAAFLWTRAAVTANAP